MFGFGLSLCFDIDQDTLKRATNQPMRIPDRLSLTVRIDDISHFIQIWIVNILGDIQFIIITEGKSPAS